LEWAQEQPQGMLILLEGEQQVDEPLQLEEE
jgi:hypothetical protein